jgi:hypothetical protein
VSTAGVTLPAITVWGDAKRANGTINGIRLDQ